MWFLLIVLGLGIELVVIVALGRAATRDFEQRETGVLAVPEEPGDDGPPVLVLSAAARHGAPAARR